MTPIRLVGVIGALVCMVGAAAFMLGYVSDSSPTMIRLGGVGLLAFLGGAATVFLAKLIYWIIGRRGGGSQAK